MALDVRSTRWSCSAKHSRMLADRTFALARKAQRSFDRCEAQCSRTIKCLGWEQVRTPSRCSDGTAAGGLQMHRATVISRVRWPATAVPRLAVCSLLLWATLCKLTIHRSSASVPAASPCQPVPECNVAMLMRGLSRRRHWVAYLKTLGISLRRAQHARSGCFAAPRHIQ